jgi:predicted Zn-ribbon and HTH transcriptional regulator
MSVLDNGLCWSCLRRWVRSRFGIRSREAFFERVYVLDDSLVEVDYRLHRIPARCRTCGHARAEEPVAVRGRSDLGAAYHEEGPHVVPAHWR